jgi:hypothetical protein
VIKILRYTIDVERPYSIFKSSSLNRDLFSTLASSIILFSLANIEGLLLILHHLQGQRTANSERVLQKDLIITSYEHNIFGSFQGGNEKIDLRTYKRNENDWEHVLLSFETIVGCIAL